MRGVILTLLVMYISNGFVLLDTLSHLQLTDLGGEQCYLGAVHKHISAYSVLLKNTQKLKFQLFIRT